MGGTTFIRKKRLLWPFLSDPSPLASRDMWTAAGAGEFVLLRSPSSVNLIRTDLGQASLAVALEAC